MIEQMSKYCKYDYWANISYLHYALLREANNAPQIFKTLQAVVLLLSNELLTI